MLILLIHEHGRSLHLLRFFDFFFRNLKFLSHRSFTSLVRIKPRYFVLFVTIAKGVVFLISFSALRKDTGLFGLILYPATLLKLFISCSNYLVELLDLLMYAIISSANSDTLTSSFPISIPLISILLLSNCSS